MGAGCKKGIEDTFFTGVGNFITNTGQITADNLNVGNLTRKLIKPKNPAVSFLEGLALNCLQSEAKAFAKDNLKQVFEDPCSGGEVPECFSVRLDIKKGSKKVIKPGESTTMIVKYCKSKQPIILGLAFLAIKGKAGNSEVVVVKKFIKSLDSEKTKGSFTLNITNKGGNNCVEPGGVLYSSSNNPKSTWVIPFIMVNGKSYKLGKNYKEDDVRLSNSCSSCGLFQFWTDYVKLAGGTSIAGDKEYCIYEVSE